MNNMSNYNLKAKNKKTGEIVDFTAMDYGYTYRYIENIKNRVFLPDGTLENPEYFTPQEFNELYEIVEDEKLSRCCNAEIELRGVRGSKEIWKSCSKCFSPTEDHTHQYDIIPKTDKGIDVDTSKKDDILIETWRDRLNNSMINLEKYISITDFIKDFFQQELERICDEVENMEVPFKQDKQTVLDGKTYNDIQLMRNTYKQAIDDIINIIKK